MGKDRDLIALNRISRRGSYGSRGWGEVVRLVEGAGFGRRRRLPLRGLDAGRVSIRCGGGGQVAGDNL